jgi:hypothetical protein
VQGYFSEFVNIAPACGQILSAGFPRPHATGGRPGSDGATARLLYKGKLRVKTSNMKTLFFGLFLMTLFVLPRIAQCRLGETLEECKARYGKPVEVKKDAALFLKNGMTVSVHFTGGKVDEISYYRRDSKDSRKSVSPTEAEVNILLRANAQDTSWELELAHRHDALWRSKEKGLSAFRTPQSLTISIADPAAYRAYHEQKTAARDLEGF